MLKRLWIIVMIGAIVVSGAWLEGMGKTEKKKDETSRIEEAYQKTVEKRRATESTEEKLALTKKFLDEYPESDRTATAVDAVYYYQAEDLGDVAGAVAYIDAVRGKIKDPEIAQACDKVLVYVYGESRMFPRMIEVADRLSADGALGFSDHWNMIESATKAQEWELVRRYCDKAGALATAEAYRREHADENLTDDDVNDGVKNRTGMLLVDGGWARANQGEVDQAIADFAKADQLVEHSFIGTADYNLNLYWGEALLMKGDHRAAAEKLAADALVMRDERALTDLKKAYVGVNGSEKGFDEYAARMHRDIAKDVGDFELGDFNGARHRLSDLRSEVTLLAFWFPT